MKRIKISHMLKCFCMLSFCLFCSVLSAEIITDKELLGASKLTENETHKALGDIFYKSGEINKSIDYYKKIKDTVFIEGNNINLFLLIDYLSIRDYKNAKIQLAGINHNSARKLWGIFTRVFEDPPSNREKYILYLNELLVLDQQATEVQEKELIKRAIYLYNVMNTTIHLNDKNGNKTAEYFTRRGMKNGPYVLYYYNSSIKKEEGVFYEGIVSGVVKKYSKDGSLFEEVTYKNEVMNGQRIYYGKDGSPLLKLAYKEGFSIVEDIAIVVCLAMIIFVLSIIAIRIRRII